MKTGIYQITNTVTGKFYIGSAARSLSQRWVEHQSRLETGVHKNRYLLSSWNKHGKECFEFTILETCPPQDCLTREQEWLDRLKPYLRSVGYNLSPTASSVLGIKHSRESKRKMSEAKKGRKLSPESIAKRTASVKGSKRSEDTKKRMKEAAKKRGISPETREKMNQYIRSDQARKKASDSRKGCLVSAATRKKQSEAQIRRYNKVRKSKGINRKGTR